MADVSLGDRGERRREAINLRFVDKLAEDVREAARLAVEYTSKPYGELSDAERYAVRYHIIVVAEALTALLLHLARRGLGVRPETPLHALRALRDAGLVRDDEYRDAVGIIRLRNLLVHRYWAIDDKRIYDNVRGDFENLLKLVERLRAYARGEV